MQTPTDKLRSFIQLANESLTRKEFNESFARLARMVRLAEENLTRKVEGIVKGKDGRDGIDGVTPIPGVHFPIPKDGKDGKDGFTPVAGVHFPIPKDGKEGQRGKDGSPDSPQQIRNKLHRLKGKERISIDAIHGLHEHIQNVMTDLFSKHVYSGGGGSVLKVMNNGAITVQATQALNLKGAGAPTIAVGQNGVTDLTFPAGGFTKLTATGTVNGSNTAFTFTSKPTYIISDGLWFVENNGWTWNAATLTATMSVPPQTGIFAFT